MNEDIEEQLKIELMDILEEDAIKVVIDPTYDIPIYISKKDKQEDYKKILVLSGGGILGVSYIGALQALEDLHCLDKFEEFAATSAGSLIISMYLIGYTPKEMWDFNNFFDYDKTKNINLLNIVNNFGVDDCSKMEYVIERLITAKGLDLDITLRDLYLKTKKKLNITVTCVNSMQPEYFNHENSPNMPLKEAIRMSISIPWFYTPYKYNNKHYVDGGVMDNYPISLYKDRLDDVIGVYLYTDNTDQVENITNLEEYSRRIFECFRIANNVNNINGYEKYTINIGINSISAVQYKLSDKQKSYMYDKGYQGVIKFYKELNK